MKEDDTERKVFTTTLAMVLIAIGAAVAVWLYAVEYTKQDLTSSAIELFKEYNVPLNVVKCGAFAIHQGNNVTIAYSCTVDANVNLRDKNTSTKFIARGNLIVVKDENNLYLYKLEPVPSEPLEEVNVPDDVRRALSSVTLVMGDRMLCKQFRRDYMKCYIPTNRATYGNASIVYEPLFEIYKEGNTIEKVIVHV